MPDLFDTGPYSPPRDGESLASRTRSRTLDEIVGQQLILDDGTHLRRIIRNHADKHILTGTA